MCFHVSLWFSVSVAWAACKLRVSLLGFIISVVPPDSLLTWVFMDEFLVSVTPSLNWADRLIRSLSSSNNQLSHSLSFPSPSSFALPLSLSLHPSRSSPALALVSLGTLFGRVAMSDIFPRCPWRLRLAAKLTSRFLSWLIKKCYTLHIRIHAHTHVPHSQRLRIVTIEWP